MLNLHEEIVLLTIDPRTGNLSGETDLRVRYALAGAILFDLALAKRIDTDVDKFIVIDDTPIGNRVHDQVLAKLARMTGAMEVRSVVDEITKAGGDLEGEALAKLVEKGIIKQQKTKLLWLLDLDKLRLLDGKERQNIAARLAQTVLTDDIPDVREIMLVSLANSCGLLGVVLAPAQIALREERIEALIRIETISRNVCAAISSMLQSQLMVHGMSTMI